MDESNVKINRKYKDTLFRMLFGREENRENLLSLVNALYDTNYTDPKEITITTMDDVIFINAKNDVSLLLDMRMYLFEQKSTISPNMPVRGLIYFAHLYDKYLDNQPISVYGTRRIPLPTPRYTVLYNGTANAPARQELRLSDSFAVPADGFEWTATFVNINAGKNDSILERCPPLWEYMQFVNEVRTRNNSGIPAGKAVQEAVDFCIDHRILYEFLKKHKAEVYDMCLTEFDEEKYRRTITEDSREEGLAQGRAEGRVEGRLGAFRDIREKLVQSGMSPVAVDAIFAGL